MFSFLVKFGNRPFAVFNIVCCRVIIQHYQIVLKILLAVWWSSGSVTGQLNISKFKVLRVCPYLKSKSYFPHNPYPAFKLMISRYFRKSHNTVYFGGLFELKQWISSSLKHDTVPRVISLIRNNANCGDKHETKQAHY